MRSVICETMLTFEVSRKPCWIVPKAVEPMGEVLERFDYLQGELLVRLDRAAGLALDSVKITSPFDARVKYNLFSAFSVIPVHQRRHLYQAESAARGVRSAG